jgi:hypothetical protein
MSGCQSTEEIKKSAEGIEGIALKAKSKGKKFK